MVTLNKQITKLKRIVALAVLVGIMNPVQAAFSFSNFNISEMKQSAYRNLQNMLGKFKQNQKTILYAIGGAALLGTILHSMGFFDSKSENKASKPLGNGNQDLIEIYNAARKSGQDRMDKQRNNKQDSQKQQQRKERKGDIFEISPDDVLKNLWPDVQEQENSVSENPVQQEKKNNNNQNNSMPSKIATKVGKGGEEIPAKIVVSKDLILTMNGIMKVAIEKNKKPEQDFIEKSEAIISYFERLVKEYHLSDLKKINGNMTFANYLRQKEKTDSTLFEVGRTNPTDVIKHFKNQYEDLTTCGIYNEKLEANTTVKQFAKNCVQRLEKLLSSMTGTLQGEISKTTEWAAFAIKPTLIKNSYNSLAKNTQVESTILEGAELIATIMMCQGEAKKFLKDTATKTGENLYIEVFKKDFFDVLDGHALDAMELIKSKISDSVSNIKGETDKIKFMAMSAQCITRKCKELCPKDMWTISDINKAYSIIKSIILGEVYKLILKKAISENEIEDLNEIRKAIDGMQIACAKKINPELMPKLKDIYSIKIDQATWQPSITPEKTN